MIKLEVTPEPRYLLPDPIETLKAAELLVADGFVVLPYIAADPILAKRLEEAGCATVMPLGSWIGSNRGLQTRDGVEAIVAMATVPVVVDAGIGAPSHAAEAMEIGCDAVLVNTAIATARDPVEIAHAFRSRSRPDAAAISPGSPSPGERFGVVAAHRVPRAMDADAELLQLQRKAERQRIVDYEPEFALDIADARRACRVVGARSDRRRRRTRALSVEHRISRTSPRCCRRPRSHVSKRSRERATS